MSPRHVSISPRRSQHASISHSAHHGSTSARHVSISPRMSQHASISHSAHHGSISPRHVSISPRQIQHSASSPGLGSRPSQAPHGRGGLQRMTTQSASGRAAAQARPKLGHLNSRTGLTRGHGLQGDEEDSSVPHSGRYLAGSGSRYGPRSTTFQEYYRNGDTTTASPDSGSQSLPDSSPPSKRGGDSKLDVCFGGHGHDALNYLTPDDTERGGRRHHAPKSSRAPFADAEDDVAPPMLSHRRMSRTFVDPPTEQSYQVHKDGDRVRLALQPEEDNSFSASHGTSCSCAVCRPVCLDTARAGTTSFSTQGRGKQIMKSSSTPSLTTATPSAPSSRRHHSFLSANELAGAKAGGDRMYAHAGAKAGGERIPGVAEPDDHFGRGHVTAPWTEYHGDFWKKVWTEQSVAPPFGPRKGRDHAVYHEQTSMQRGNDAVSHADSHDAERRGLSTRCSKAVADLCRYEGARTGKSHGAFSERLRSDRSATPPPSAHVDVSTRSAGCASRQQVRRPVISEQTSDHMGSLLRDTDQLRQREAQAMHSERVAKEADFAQKCHVVEQRRDERVASGAAAHGVRSGRNARNADSVPNILYWDG